MADKKCCHGSDPTCDRPATCAERAWAENERLRNEVAVRDEALMACLRDSDSVSVLLADERTRLGEARHG